MTVPCRYWRYPSGDISGWPAIACTVRRNSCRLPSISRIAGRTKTSKDTSADDRLTGDADDRDRRPSAIAVVGFISLAPRPDNGLRSLGLLEDLPGVIEREGIDEVIIADPDFPQRQAVDLVDTCHQRGVRVRVVLSTMEVLIHRADFVPGEAVPLFELRSPQFEGLDFAVKRTFDILGAGLLLLLLSPS